LRLYFAAGYLCKCPPKEDRSSSFLYESRRAAANASFHGNFQVNIEDNSCLEELEELGNGQGAFFG